MLQDYEYSPLQKNRSLQENRWLIGLEFVLVLLMLQSALLFVFGYEESVQSPLRFRILAHSDAASDQQVKVTIQQAIEPLLQQALASAKDPQDVANQVEKISADILYLANSHAEGRTVTFERKQALFPPKRLSFAISPQAPYDAYILTIGSGKGDNWWCSLFPNVCFPEEESSEEEEVKFFIWEWIKSWFD